MHRLSEDRGGHSLRKQDFSLIERKRRERARKQVVTPVKTGVQRIKNKLKRLDSGFRRNDGKNPFVNSCETVKVPSKKAQIKVTDLSRFLVYILAHRPDEFGLVPDPAGFVPIKDLLRAVHEEPGWGYVREGHLREVLLGRDRALFVREEDRLRSAEKRWQLDLQTPSQNTPKILLIAIRRKAHGHVMEKGLFSDRPLVLSPDRDMAQRIGQRRDHKPIMLEVLTGPARQQGVLFHAFGVLYLAKEIPPEFISGPPVPEEIPELQPAGKAKPAPQPTAFSGGTFVLEAHRDPDPSRRRDGRKPRGWKEDSRKMRRNKG